MKNSLGRDAVRSIYVATPSLRASVHMPYVVGLCALQAFCLERGLGFEFGSLTGVSVIGFARNVLASRFLTETAHSHMLFVDDDLGFNAAEIGCMFDYADADVVAALCPKRRMDWGRIKEAVLKHPDVPISSLPHLAGDYTGMFMLAGDADRMSAGTKPMEMLTVGAGIMLISRVCLQRIVDDQAVAKFYDADFSPNPIFNFFECVVSQGRMVGEDINFCNLVRRQGGVILGCPWPVVTHSGNYDFVGDIPGIANFQ